MSDLSPSIFFNSLPFTSPARCMLHAQLRSLRREIREPVAMVTPVRRCDGLGGGGVRD